MQFVLFLQLFNILLGCQSMNLELNVNMELDVGVVWNVLHYIWTSGDVLSL